METVVSGNVGMFPPRKRHNMREKKKEEIKNLDDLIRSEGFSAFDADRRGNQMFLDDPERADRCYDAAENGSDGSTHAEIIQDWRDYLGTLRVIDPEFPEENGDITETVLDLIVSEIDACEEWHAKNGSLHKQLG
jgi:hypothetical protein